METANKTRKTRIRKHEKLIAGEIYMNSSKAAEMLGVSKNCILYYARNGLKHLDLGGFKYFQQAWLNEFVQSRITYGEGK